MGSNDPFLVKYIEPAESRHLDKEVVDVFKNFAIGRFEPIGSATYVKMRYKTDLDGNGYVYFGDCTDEDFGKKFAEKIQIKLKYLAEQDNNCDSRSENRH